MTIMRWRFICIFQFLALMYTAPASAEQELSFGIFPYISPASLVEFQSPLKRYIEENLNQPVAIVTAQDFDTFLERTQKAEYDILYTAPHFGRIAQKQNGYIPLVMTSHKVQGYFLVKNESPVKKLEDLKDKTVMIAQRKSVLFQLTEHKLRQHGLMEGKNITLLETRTHNNALYAPLRDEADASVTGVLLWHTLGQEYKEKMHILDTTDSVPGFFILVHSRVPQAKRDKLKQALLNFSSTDEGREYFKKTGFIGMEPLPEKILKAMDQYTKAVVQQQ